MSGESQTRRRWLARSNDRGRRLVDAMLPAILAC